MNKDQKARLDLLSSRLASNQIYSVSDIEQLGIPNIRESIVKFVTIGLVGSELEALTVCPAAALSRREVLDKVPPLPIGWKEVVAQMVKDRSKDGSIPSPSELIMEIHRTLSEVTFA